MKKKTSDQNESQANSPIGENIVLKLVVPEAKAKQVYQKVLTNTAGHVTVPGFRKGKAPTRLVEDQIGATVIIDKVLENVLPEIYAEAVKEAKITPLVHPHLEIQKIPEHGDWVISAATAVAPVVVLGDWKKLVKTTGKEFEEAEKKEKSSASKKETDTKEQQKEAKPDNRDERKMSFLFGKLIQTINPKIAPLLLEHEARRQIEEFAKHLAEHHVELNQYLQGTGKTIEQLQQDYAASGLASLQIEFVLNAISDELKVSVSEEEISELLGEGVKKIAAETRERLEENAKQILTRRKTVEEIKSLFD